MPLPIMINRLSESPIRDLHLLGRLQINFIGRLNNINNKNNSDGNNNDDE